MNCKNCLGCTAQGEKNFIEPERCNNFVEDITNIEVKKIVKKIEYKQMKIN